MKRTFITAILFAITASNVNAQQANTVVGSAQQYGVIPNGYQSYQTQVPQQQLQLSQPRHYQYQTQPANQHLGSVTQQGSLQTYYYPHPQSTAGGVVSSSLSTAPAQMGSDLKSVIQRVETQQFPAQQDYLALPTKSRPPAPSIPPQPEDLAGQPVQSGQQSEFNTRPSRTLPAAEQLALPSKALAPAPSIPVQPEEFIAPSDTANLASQQEPKAALPQATLEAEVVVEPKANQPAAVSDLAVAPKASTEEKSSQAVEERAVEELAATKELAVNETRSATEELLGPEELAEIDSLAGTLEPSEANELVAVEDNAEQPSRVEMGELFLGDEVEPPELKIEELALEEEEAEADDSATALAVAPLDTNSDAQHSTIQSPAETTTVAPIVSTERNNQDLVAQQTTAPVELQRSSSYGGWMLGLMLAMGVPFAAWLAVRKKKQNDLEARFAEAALHRVNDKASKPSETKAASPELAAKTVAKKTAVAPTLAPAPVKEKPAPVAATAQTQAARPKQTKKTQTTGTPSTDVAAAGILSMDDLEEVMQTASDVPEKASIGTVPAAAESKSTSQAQVSATSGLGRIEIPTEIVKIADRDNLTSISGIDEATQHALHKAGYLCFGDLAKANERDLELALSKCDHGFSSSDFKRWTAQAALAGQDVSNTVETQEVAPAATETSAFSDAKPVAAPADQSDDLTKIRGVGPATAELLRANGITSFATLSKAGTPRLQEILASGGDKFAPLDPSMWCRQAEFAISGSWARSRVETVYTQKAQAEDSAPQPTANPVATKSTSAAQQDDLTKIAGVGSDVQEVLRSNGVERFEQIGRMTADQINQMLASQGSRFQGLLTTSWPVQARALTTGLTESSVLAEVNSIIDMAKSSGEATTKPDVPSVDAANEKAASK